MKEFGEYELWRTTSILRRLGRSTRTACQRPISHEHLAARTGAVSRVNDSFLDSVVDVMFVIGSDVRENKCRSY